MDLSNERVKTQTASENVDTVIEDGTAVKTRTKKGRKKMLPIGLATLVFFVVLIAAIGVIQFKKRKPIEKVEREAIPQAFLKLPDDAEKLKYEECVKNASVCLRDLTSRNMFMFMTKGRAAKAAAVHAEVMYRANPASPWAPIAMEFSNILQEQLKIGMAIKARSKPTKPDYDQLVALRTRMNKATELVVAQLRTSITKGEGVGEHAKADLAMLLSQKPFFDVFFKRMFNEMKPYSKEIKNAGLPADLKAEPVQTRYLYAWFIGRYSPYYVDKCLFEALKEASLWNVEGLKHGGFTWFQRKFS